MTTICNRLPLLFEAIVLVAMATTAKMTQESDSLVTSAAPDSSVNRDVIAAARCRVRCLSLLKSSIDMTILPNVMETTSLMNCLQDDDCSTCMKPCNHPLLSLHSCDDVCKAPKEEGESICSESCGFLKEVIRRNKPLGSGPGGGFCPSVPSPGVEGSGAGNPCSVGGPGGKRCSDDSGCDGDRRCCTTRCGLICVEPVSTTSDDFPQVPQVPQVPTLKDKTKTGSSVELKWNSVAENDTGPVLYVVDSRWNIGKRHDEREMTSWQQVTQTTGTSALLSDINPGRWYQFRVIAVSMGGSRGASAPTPAFTPSKEPRKPGPPTNLTEGDTLIAGGKMSVTIRWFPPKRSDLPVTRYKLFWSKRLKANAAESAENREFRRLLPGDRLTYQLHDLESDTTYIVQVQAICQFGDERLKSDKSSVYITTYSLPNPSEQYGGGGGGLPGESGGGGGRQLPPTPAPVKGLFVDKPFYENGSLKTNVTWCCVGNDGAAVRGGGGGVGGGGLPRFLVRWSAEACIADAAAVDGDRSLSTVMSTTTNESHFVIYDLRIDCRYLVKVEPISGHGVTGKVAVASFSTPACSQLECLDNAAGIPDQPQHLTHSFLISSSNITSRLSWGVPASENPIVGYRVVWGPVVRSSPHHHHHLLHRHHPSPTRDKALTNVKILPKDVRSVNLGNLLEGTTYLLEVQAMTKMATGRTASILIATPLLQLTPIDKKQQDSLRKRTSFASNSTAVIIMMMKTTTTSRPERTFQRPQQTHSSASLSCTSAVGLSSLLLLLLLLLL